MACHLKLAWRAKGGAPGRIRTADLLITKPEFYDLISIVRQRVRVLRRTIDSKFFTGQLVDFHGVKFFQKYKLFCCSLPISMFPAYGAKGVTRGIQPRGGLLISTATAMPGA
jgi:hypothetical protein